MKQKKTSLRSWDWLRHDRSFITRRFTDIGFKYADEVLGLRVFDLLNLDRIDSETGRAMIRALYHLYNPNPLVDEGIEQKQIDQYYPFDRWRNQHRDLSRVLVRDLVMADNINWRAIEHLYNRILKSFYKSKEYNNREYGFMNYHEMLHRRKEYNR